MFKLYLAVLVLIFAPLASTAQETLPAPMFIMADCDYTRSIKRFIYEDLREIPFSGGWGIMRREDGEFVEGQWKIYVSPDWSTYTIAIEFPNDGAMCLVGMGDGIEPFEDRGTR